ncbi:MAG TPA: DUF2497 domain-containing protein [Hyphomicrobium sp.]|nr:DUF2497 domain-containing protein [Hyphomicrobium sp.]
MTRLDATSEPSMEDILASIRKIIAEDPPGSRPVPAPLPARAPVQSQPSTFKAPERDAFIPMSGRGSKTSAPQPTLSAPEPYLTATPDQSASQPFANEPFFSTAPSPSETDAPSSRIEPSFSSSARPDSELAPSATNTMSVDAQLSDLLGDVMPERASGSTTDAVPSQSIYKAPATTSMPADSRPGFTVSRDGFLAGSTTTPAKAGSDPFDFDLGPSPFHTTPAAPGLATNSLTARMSASALERISAPSDAGSSPAVANAGSQAAVASDDVVPAPDADAAQASPTDVSGTQASPTDVSATEASEIEQATVTIVMPSIAATIAPLSATPSPAPEPVARFIPANASVEAPKAIDRDVLEVMAPQRISSSAPAMEVLRVQAETEVITSASTSTSVGPSIPEGDVRSMEDTVAELLRPMLKAWLAENMPRIVERALRRELSEQLLIDTKAAAE